jgi:hypothetical protein
VPRLLKTLPLTLAVAALIVFAPSCGSSNSQIRFVNAMQDGAAMDIDVNGNKVFSDISFLGVMPTQPGYTAVPSGNDTIEGFLTGETTVGFNGTSVGWSDSSVYTVVATGFVASGQNAAILSIPDNNAPPPSDDVEFRVIHASPSGPGAVDIYIEPAPFSGTLQGLTPAISSLAYTQGSSYVPLPYNTSGAGYTVYVTASGNSVPIFSELINSPTGSIRTLVLTDVQNGTAMSQSFLVLPDLN